MPRRANKTNSLDSREMVLAPVSIPNQSADLLLAEYNYIASISEKLAVDNLQIPKKVFGFDLSAISALVVGYLSGQISIDPALSTSVSLFISGYLVYTAVRGTETVMEIARKRMAWYECVLALSQIKEHFIKHDKELVKALRWRKETMPQAYKINGTHYDLAIQVSILSGLLFSLSLFLTFGFFGLSGILLWIVAAISGLFYVIVNLSIYKRMLIG